MIADMDRALAGAQTLRDRIKANDIPGAKKAWIDARVGWERSEVFTSGFIPDLDDAIDAWPDAVTGFHGMEVKLFGANSGDVGDEMDKLIVHLTDADERIPHHATDAPRPPQRRYPARLRDRRQQG